ncbi:MAG: hypothetical protein OCD00_15335 [Colwellia sp.]
MKTKLLSLLRLFPRLPLFLVLIRAPLALILFASAAVFANETKPITIPVIEHATVFAEFTDEMPAVINYFTLASEQQIIDFYQQNYGEVLSQQRKRGRLTLHFAQNMQQEIPKSKLQRIRVIISQQSKKRQVDVMVEYQ